MKAYLHKSVQYLAKKIIISFLILIAFLPGIDSISQQPYKEIKPDQYRAVHWTTQDGLSNDQSNVMIKDVKGFLWLGSAGGALCRFDGARFKKYFPEPNKSGAINSDAIFGFVEDSLNNIWIGTGIGLSRYDIKADTFTNFVSIIDSVNANRSVIPFWSTRDQLYCLQSGYRIVAYDIYSLKGKTVLTLSESDRTIRSGAGIVYTIVDTVSKCLWMLERNYDQPGEEGLLQIFLGDGKRKHYTWPCYRNLPNHGHSCEAMQLDRKRNSIWINSPDGLLEFTLADKRFHHIDAFNEFIKLKGYDRWVGIDIDREGDIWLATQPKGILIYDPKTEQVQQLFSDPGLQKNIGQANFHIYCDRDGIVWTSNWMSNGIYELLLFNPSVKRYAAKPEIQDSLSDSFVISIIPAAQGKIWIGTYEGINIFDPISEKFEVLREKDLPGIRGKAIAPVHIDTVRQKAWLYAGSAVPANPMKFYERGGMYEMDIKTRKCRPITFRDGAKQFDSLIIDPTLVRPYKNGILVCTDYYGLFEIKEGSLFADLVVPLYIKDMISNVVLEEERFVFLKIWNALPNFNFENKEGKWIKISHPLDSLDWFFMIYNEKDQTHWASFKYKLVHYDKNFREIKTYSEEDGYSGLILKMIIDNTGNLWFTNDLEQVGRLNVATGIITMLSETDGYHKKDFDWAVPLAKDSRSNLYFGTGLTKGNKGLDRIYPQRYFSAPTSSVYVRSLTINQKPFPLSTAVNSLEELSLRYNQNTISIETGIIDYYAKGKGHLRYKLIREGKDAEWQYGTAYNTIRYDGLVPGKYKLVMQSSNVDGEFNSPEKILMIAISTPFWQTWWFRITAVICTAALFYEVIRWRLQQKFRLQLERSEKERQVAELQQQKTELEMQALRVQMNPHFIFNSLNSINRFILQNNRTQASEYLTKFSKLVRMILQNSQASLITLETELEALGLYLEMEALRFNYHFAYKISVPKDLDIEVLKVPPLIIQPYVENAIWHGLMHKEEKGSLDIEVTQQDDYLFFKVTDDGIGRKQAAALASKTATKHKSMGLRITADRIAMIQSSNGSPVTINDLVNPDGTAAGTEVIIKMPVIEKD